MLFARVLQVGSANNMRMQYVGDHTIFVMENRY